MKRRGESYTGARRRTPLSNARCKIYYGNARGFVETLRSSFVYAADWRRVAADVAALPDHARRSWQMFLAEVETDPHPRQGTHVDRLVPIRGFPMRTWIYEITEETSVSGQPVFVFSAEFFPEYAPVYSIDEDKEEIIVLYLRDNRRY